MAIKMAETEVNSSWTTAQVTVKMVSQITRLPLGSPPQPPTSKIDFDWVLIPAGEFLMGSDKTKDKDARDNEMPQHKLFLPGYKIARWPVTVAEFAQFVKETGYKTTAEELGSAWDYDGKEWKEITGAYWAVPRGASSDVQSKQNHPVTCVSWHDAMKFCVWAGVRLPSEAEWERASRGSNGHLYPWGNEAPNRNRCNFNMNVKDTTPVDTYPKGATPEGLLDMAGNVWEWTSTKHEAYPYDEKDGREERDGEEERVLRGGSWVFGPKSVRGAYRLIHSTKDRNSNVGFRVVALVSPNS